MYLTDLQVSLLPCKYIRWAGNQTVRNFFWFNFFYSTMKVMGVTFIHSLEKSLAPRHFWQAWIMYILVCIQYQQLLHCNYVECDCGVHVQCIIICVWYDTNSWYLFIYFSHFEQIFFSAFFSSCQQKEWKRWLKGIFYFSCLHGYKCSLIWGTQKVFVCLFMKIKKQFSFAVARNWYH